MELNDILAIIVMPFAVAYTELRIRYGAKEASETVKDELLKEIKKQGDALIKIGQALEDDLKHSTEIHNLILSQMSDINQRVGALESEKRS